MQAHSSMLASAGIALPRPHDLLWIADWQAFRCEGSPPPWADAALRRGSPLVVRRDRRVLGSIPVGLRGDARHERLAGVVERAAVLRHASPELLARRALTQPDAAPIGAALARIIPLLDKCGLQWGPTGSLGFALATGWPALRPASDIDLLVRAPLPLSANQTALLDSLGTSAGWRVDLQIDTGHGGFAFAEWIRSGGMVLLKTDTGPYMTGDPWNLSGWLDDADGQAA